VDNVPEQPSCEAENSLEETVTCRVTFRLYGGDTHPNDEDVTLIYVDL
jgi:hypothetical protein